MRGSILKREDGVALVDEGGELFVGPIEVGRVDFLRSFMLDKTPDTADSWKEGVEKDAVPLLLPIMVLPFVVICGIVIDGVSFGMTHEIEDFADAKRGEGLLRGGWGMTKS